MHVRLFRPSYQHSVVLVSSVPPRVIKTSNHNAVMKSKPQRPIVAVSRRSCCCPVAPCMTKPALAISVLVAQDGQGLARSTRSPLDRTWSRKGFPTWLVDAPLSSRATPSQPPCQGDTRQALSVHAKVVDKVLGLCTQSLREDTSRGPP